MPCLCTVGVTCFQQLWQNALSSIPQRINLLWQLETLSPFKLIGQVL